MDDTTGISSNITMSFVSIQDMKWLRRITVQHGEFSYFSYVNGITETQYILEPFSLYAGYAFSTSNICFLGWQHVLWFCEYRNPMTYNDLLRILLLLFVYFLRFTRAPIVWALPVQQFINLPINIQLKNKYEHKQHLQEQKDILTRNKKCPF